MTCWGHENVDGDFDLDGNFKDVAAGEENVCGLLDDGRLICGSGSGTPGPFVALTNGCALARNGTATCFYGSYDRAVGMPACTPFRQITAGERHVCGLREDHSVVCWGNDGFGQSTPPQGSFHQISAGRSHTCGVRTDDTISCWGEPSRTQAPTGTYVQVSAGLKHTCALRTDGKVVCWGDDSAFQSSPPADLAFSPDEIGQISVAGNSAVPFEGDVATLATTGCGLRVDGSIACFGETVPPSGTFAKLFVGTAASCALDAAGALTCFPGPDSYGAPMPPAALLSDTYTEVSLGFVRGCALKTNGELVCWGDRDVPGSPPPGTYLSVSESGRASIEELEDNSDYFEHGCAIRTDGDVLCWGYSDGLERIVAGPFVEIAAGYFRDCARRANGSVVCWRADGTSAVVPIDGTFTKIGAGESFQGLRSDGTVLAIDYTGVESMPVEGTFIDLSVAGDYACGLQAIGVVRCWGSRVR
jgi:hypothetical protein